MTRCGDIDPVNHPNHYTSGGIECIDAIRAATGEGFSAYCQGNIIKYLWRYREKGGTEDLRKAQVYLNWMIESLEVQYGSKRRWGTLRKNKKSHGVFGRRQKQEVQ